MPHSYNGILFLDKPSGMSSNHALQKVRRLFANAKAGYAGTLDPLASGLLPVCIGEATKFISFFSDASKSYESTVKLGYRSTTGDAEGELSQTGFVAIDKAGLDAVVKAFTGNGEQIPPMYSAIKVDGKPLYKLARQGKTIYRAKRQITIHSLSIVKKADNVLNLSVTCSKGTYIRVLAEDIAASLGTDGYLTSLRRTGLGEVSVSESVTLLQIEEVELTSRAKFLRNIDFSLAHLARLSLIQNNERRFTNGVETEVSATVMAAGAVSVYTHDGIFVGLGALTDTGLLKPKRLMSQEFIETSRNIEIVN
ncbi:MAG: tRNA pseudouridine(55) synthase TruB [Proteobacteria bacterium]|nr:tRNA pseudouridine(55) synthase TruB [Pseudomonadota bacterium]MDA1331843.1 tRNA pseudouridine(55) synthase TruB [Pseudomonadota bacterium]